MLTRDTTFFQDKAELLSEEHKGIMLDIELKKIYNYVVKQLIPKLKLANLNTETFLKGGNNGDVLYKDNQGILTWRNAKEITGNVKLSYEDIDLSALHDGFLFVDDGKLKTFAPQEEGNYVLGINGKTYSAIKTSQIPLTYTNVRVQNETLKQYNLNVSIIDKVSQISLDRRVNYGNTGDVTYVTREVLNSLLLYPSFSENLFKLKEGQKISYKKFDGYLKKSNYFSNLSSQYGQFGKLLSTSALFNNPNFNKVLKIANDTSVIKRPTNIKVDCDKLNEDNFDLNFDSLKELNAEEVDSYILNQSVFDFDQEDMQYTSQGTSTAVSDITYQWRGLLSGDLTRKFFKTNDQGNVHQDMQYFNSIEAHFEPEVYQAFKRKFPNL